MIAIPHELSDYIVDFLHGDRRALMACGLTCRSWYPAARYHLYSRIYLSSPAACRILLQLLDGSPYLGQFTRYLSMSKAIRHVSGVNTEDDTDDKLSGDWSTLFTFLPNVQQLELSFLEMNIAFHSALVSNFTRTTELTLQYCRFPSFGDFTSVLLSFPSLRCCTLRGISWESDQTALTSVTTERRDARISIKGLTLGRDLDLQELIEWLLQEHICDELESVAACLAFEGDAIMLGELLRASAPTVRHVDLDWYCKSYRDVRLPFEFTLADCSSLETLSLRCPIALESTVSWVNALLADVNPAKLKSFTFEVRLLGSLLGLNWARMERQLLQDTFKALRTVAVKVAVWHTAVEHLQDIGSFVRSHLPNLHSRGMLEYIA